MIQISDTCWHWTGRITTFGYGEVTKGSRINGTNRTYRAHRLAYETLVGPIPDGMELDHLCKNRRCVNPSHLEPVSHAENHRRANCSRNGAHERTKTHCPQGHPYMGENLYISQTRRGTPARRCRTCQRRHGFTYRHKSP